MKKNLTKEEYKEWLKSQNMNLYRFYNSNNESLYKGWLNSRKEASDSVKASNGKISYYKEVPIYVVQNEDGTYSIHENIIKDEEKEPLYDKVVWFVYRTLDRIQQVISFIKDTIHYFKTYKKKVVHDRNIWYCLSGHILEDLKQNLPKLRDKSTGYPAYLKNEQEWYDKIDEMLLLLQSYFIYKDIYGIVPEETPQEWAKLGQKFIDNYKNLIKNIPYYENSHDIDYMKLNDLISKIWDDMWEWMKKHGGDLWD